LGVKPTIGMPFKEFRRNFSCHELRKPSTCLSCLRPRYKPDITQ
jgi:hypothetical protein